MKAKAFQFHYMRVLFLLQSMSFDGTTFFPYFIYSSTILLFSFLYCITFKLYGKEKNTSTDIMNTGIKRDYFSP